MSLLLQYSMCSNNSLYTQRLHCWNWSPEPEGYSSCTISTKYYRYYQVRNNKVLDSLKRLSFPVILSSFTSYLAVLAAVPIHVIGPGWSICMATNSVREGKFDICHWPGRGQRVVSSPTKKINKKRLLKCKIKPFQAF